MRTISLSSGFYPGKLMPDMVSELAAQGAKALELLMIPDRFDYTSREYVETMMKTFRSCQIQVPTAHLPFGPNLDLSDPSSVVHDHIMVNMRQAIAAAHRCGATVLILHACRRLATEHDRTARLETAIERMKEIVAMLPDGLKLAIENLPPGYLCCEAEEIIRVLECLDDTRAGVCLDTGHAHLSGQMSAMLRLCGNRLLNIHVHDNLGDDDTHLIPGQGHINWNELQDGLDRCGYRGPLTYEILEMSDPLRREAFWRQLYHDVPPLR